MAYFQGLCSFQGVYVMTQFCWYCSVNPKPWRCRKPLTKRFKQEILVKHQPLPRGGMFSENVWTSRSPNHKSLRSTKTAKSHRVIIIQEISPEMCFNCIRHDFLVCNLWGFRDAQKDFKLLCLYLLYMVVFYQPLPCQVSLKTHPAATFLLRLDMFTKPPKTQTVLLMDTNPQKTTTSDVQNYGWWTKSCTSSYSKYPIIYRVLYIPGGAGLLPSTV